MKRLPLVFFTADDGAGQGGAGAGEPTPPANPPASVAVEKKYTDDEMNAIVLKNTTKAQEKILKDLGITDVKTGKEGLEAFRKWQDEQKSETERKDAQVKELSEGKSAAEIRAEKAEAKAEALANGVPADRIERVMKLALSGNYEGSTEEKIKAVIAEFPEFIKAPEGGSFGSAPKNEQVSSTDALLQMALKHAGVK